ncbi:hypothetical protein ACSS6W_000261 [Trichoderma asperelloides]
MSSFFQPQPQWIATPTCGLYTYSNGLRKFLPLVSLDVHTVIVSSTSRTALTQTFHSPKTGTASHVENVSYLFPLYDGVSVVAFTCTVGSRVIKGVVKERNEAKQAFDAAIAQGKTAGLLEQSLEASDVFTTSLGNILTGENVKVEITYLGELKHDAQVDGLRFTIPTSVAQRYGQYTLGETNPLQGGEHINITIDVDVPGSSAIKSVQSPSHPISVNIGTLSTATSEPPSLQRAYATLSQGSAELNKDFVIQIVATGLGDPMAILETHPTIPNQRALMTTLVPRFNLPMTMAEVVFMCDRSGSMGTGLKMRNVIEALKVFLKSLPVGVKFNICSFGTSYSFLWERSQTYDETSLRMAVNHVSSFDSNFGGTEMYNPMAEIFNRRYSDMNLEVILLTDGETWHQEQLFELINTHVTQSNGAIRVFALGVGEMASHALIEGVARAGNGFAQTVADGERVDKMLVRMLKGALTPHINDYTLDINYGEEEDGDDFEIIEKVMVAMTLKQTSTKSANSTKSSDINATGKYQISISLFDESVQDEDLEMSGTSRLKVDLPAVAVPRYLQAPFKIPQLYPFSRTTVYVLLSDSTPSLQPKSVILRGTSNQGPLSLEIPITILQEKGTTIHQLAARKATRELEDGRGWIFHAKDEEGQLLRQRYDGQFSDMVKREAVHLGTQYQVSGKWCSFVAIQDTEDNTDDSQGKVIINNNEENAEKGSVINSPGAQHVAQHNIAAASLHVLAKSKKKCKLHTMPDLPQGQAANAGLSASGSRYDMQDVGKSQPRVIQPPMPRQLYKTRHIPMGQPMAQPQGMAMAQPQGMARHLQMGQQQPMTPQQSMAYQQLMAQQQAMAQAMKHQQPMPQQSIAHQQVMAQQQAIAQAMIQQRTMLQSNTNPPAVFGSSSSSNTGGFMSGHSSPMNQLNRAATSPFDLGGPLMKLNADNSAGAPSSTKRESTHASTDDSNKRAKSDDVLSDFDFDNFLAQPEDMIDYSDDESTPMPAPLPEQTTPMSALFSEQTFIGNWAWSPRLETIVGMTKSAALADIQLPGQYGQLHTVLATLCAVVYLRKKLADEKDVWELIVQKAEDWLRGQTQEDVMELEKIVERALFIDKTA